MRIQLLRTLAVSCAWISACGAPAGMPVTDASAAAELAHGMALVNLNEYERGTDALRAAIAATATDSPLRAQAHRWIGEACERQHDPEGALGEYRLALALTPDDPWLHFASGVSWSEMGELERALACFTRALELEPRHIKALQWRGETRCLLGDPAAAVSDLTRALELIEGADPATLAAWKGDKLQLQLRTLATRIRAYEALGDHDAAARDRARREELLGR